MPRLVYRYMNAATGWECLKEGSLAFTPPGLLNDPFDSNPALDFNISDEQLERLRQRRPPGMPLDRARTQAAMKRTRNAFLYNTSGVACFTSKRDDPLMWAHYGDKHRGVMVGFDAKQFGHLQHADYSETRPRVDAEASEVDKALLVKSSIWGYEDEWRLTAKLSRCEVRIVGGVPIYIQRPDRKCFVSITFGCRADEPFIVAVAYGLKQWGMEHCLLRRLHLCDETYKFEVREMSLKDFWQLKD